MAPQFMRLVGICLLIFAPGYSSVFAEGSSWFARSWQVEDGLPADNVTGIAQTQDGFLWIATQSGLARFDGLRIEPVPIPIGRTYPIIRAMLLDKDAGLWLAEEAGVLVHWAGGKVGMLTETNGLPRALALEMVQSGDGAIWISYADGAVCRVFDGKVSLFGEEQGLPAGGTCSLTSTPEGSLWFAKAGSTGVFRQERFVPLLTFPDKNIQVKAGRNKQVWFCAGDKIFKFAEGKSAAEEVGRLPAETASTRSSTLYEDAAGSLWIGTSANGLFRFHGTNTYKVDTSHGRIRVIKEDREGNIWVGTDGGGLNRVRLQVVELQGKDAGLPFETVRSTCEDASGRIWVVMQNGEVARRDDEGWSTISSSDAWPGGQATCVVGDNEGVIWLGTYSHGLYRFKDGKFSPVRRREGLASSSVRALFCGRQGDLWIAFATNNTLQRMTQGKFQNYSLPEGSRAVRAICEDANGTVWLANLDAQLLRVNGNQVVDETSRTIQPKRPIRCLAGTSDGSLWIGYSAAGIGRLKNGQFCNLGTEQGLKDASICSMMPDRRGWMWFGSDHGIFRARLQELEDVAEKRETSVRATGYGRDDGLPSLQGYYGYAPGAASARDGRILIPTHSGLVIAHPDRVQTNRAAPPVIIERVLIDGTEVQNLSNRSFAAERVKSRSQSASPQKTNSKGHDEVVIGPGHKKVELIFTAPSFIEPKAINFRYKLEGWDESWVDPGEQRLAIYPHLPAGKFQFRVKAGNGEGVWNEAGASIVFRVKPFLWQTWWFRIAAGIMITIGTFAMVRYILLRRLNAQLRRLEQENALQRERARIAQDIHDDLGARMTQISLLADRTQKALKQPERAGEHVSQIAAMSREGIKSLDEIVWAVNPRNDTLPDLLDYAGQYAVDFLAAAGIRCRLHFPDSPPPRAVSAEMRHGLFLALKEALHNVAKHAGATEVQLRASVSEAGIEWIIEDNGRGFDRAPQASFADGLGNMRRRLAELGGVCSVDGRPGEGTRIKFEVPLKNGR